MSTAVMAACWPLQMSPEKIAQAAREHEAIQLFTDFVRAHRAELLAAAHFGDGECGAYAKILREELLPPNPSHGMRQRTKDKIPRSLAKHVFERDAYRCVQCGGFKDLSCDHIIPESKGGATNFENLQTMCMRCNRSKGTRYE